MKNQDHILKELQNYVDSNKVLSKEIRKDSKTLPDSHSVGRISNSLNQINENNFKIKILMSVLL